MAMMVEILNNKINEMRDLRQREERRDNKAAQDVVDKKFASLTDQVHQLIEALKWTKTNLQFQLSDPLLLNLESLLIDEKMSISSGFAEKEAVNNVETGLKNIQQSVKKEWQKQYSELTDSTINTLRVIYSIESESVSKCLSGIGKGENWTTDINELDSMKKCLSDAKSLIAGLGLDQRIVDFLQKMNAGRATLADLDDSVSLWLKKESLDRRVQLSFASSSKKFRI